MTAMVQTGNPQYTLSDDGKMLTVFIPVRFEKRGKRSKLFLRYYFQAWFDTGLP
ncbi:MAG: hypothetical protein G8345_10315 [Magnetococcales bacterium]|nr:hypothetical protein [Magnetococcales bacterium]NGZ27266.1 hypothetical protein [Magnetococcales bacterium]